MFRHGFVMALGLMMAVAFTVGQTSAANSADVNWSRVVAAAKTEGKVVLYGVNAVSVLVRIKAEFEKTYPGIVLEYARFASSGVVVKLDQERQASSAEGADVGLTPDFLWARDRAKEGLLKAPLGPSAKVWPAAYLVSGTIPILAIEPIVLVYNVDLVKAPIVGYQDFLRPEFKGKFTWGDAISPTAVAWNDWVERTQGAGFLERIAAQNPKILGSVQNAQSVAAGETLATASTIMAIAVPLIEAGAPIKVAIPNPSFGFATVGVIPAWAKRPNAAMVLLDFLMSRQGQAAWNGAGTSASPLTGIPGALDARTMKAYDPGPYTADIVKAYQEKWGKLFNAR